MTEENDDNEKLSLFILHHMWLHLRQMDLPPNPLSGLETRLSLSGKPILVFQNGIFIHPDREKDFTDLIKNNLMTFPAELPERSENVPTLFGIPIYTRPGMPTDEIALISGGHIQIIKFSKLDNT